MLKSAPNKHATNSTNTWRACDDCGRIQFVDAYYVIDGQDFCIDCATRKAMALLVGMSAD